MLAIALIVSVIGAYITYGDLTASFNRHIAADKAQRGVATLYRLTLDEETGLRGYLASGQHSFLQPYMAAAPKFSPVLLEVWQHVQASSLQQGRAPLADLRKSHSRWQQEVAAPLIADRRRADRLARERHGMYLVNRMRADFAKVDGLIEREIAQAVDDSRALLIRASASTAAFILLFGVAALIADIVRSRTQVALERERTIADTLQRAFLSGWDVLPYLRVGTAYVSATGEAAIGGDIFDVHRLDEHRSGLLVADVSGKGIDAAVETAFVKYTIRALCEDYNQAGVVMDRFNRLFSKTITDPGSFVSAFFGILDDRDMLLTYASAGHASAYLLRDRKVEQLPVTGPVIGLSPDNSFGINRVRMQPDDILVLATDGLSEARNPEGKMLEDAGAMEWIAGGPREPQALADELVRRLSAFGGGSITDDLALLVIKMIGVTAREPLPQLA